MVPETEKINFMHMYIIHTSTVIPTNVILLKGKKVNWIKDEMGIRRIGKRRNKGDIYGKTPFETPCY
jgi:hypothetical protein